METEESAQDHNNISTMSAPTYDRAEITSSKFLSTEALETITTLEPKLENKKRNKSFQKKNREQMRNRIKNSLFSNSKNTSITCSMDNLVDSIGQNQQTNHDQQTVNSLCMIPPLSPVLPSERTICDSYLSQSVVPPSNIECTPSQRQVFLRLQSNENQQEIEKEREQSIFKISGNFSDFYDLQETLGEGCVGLVKKATRKSDGKVFAVKTVRTRDEETIQNIKQEFIHLKKLNHPNIVKVYELYVDNINGKIHSVMELIHGKEMFEVIHELGHYSELVASRIFAQILDAIAYMHQNYCCHRDLKPNNILCNNDGSEVKITDFNVSKFSDHYKNYQGGENIINQSIKMWTYTGTMAFSAPEVFNGDSYDETIDMWSAGCILFTMLSGREPFQAEYVNDLVQQICQGKFNFNDPVWNDISTEAKDLISKCLTVDSTQRIKPEDALQHPFITRGRVNNDDNECDSPLKVNMQIEKPTLLNNSECVDDEKSNESNSTIFQTNLCRKQLNDNIDRLIVNNSKKINRKSIKAFSHCCNDRRRAASSFTVQFNGISNQICDFNYPDNLKEELMDQEVQADNQTNYSNEIKKFIERNTSKKFSIIFSKQDCFSKHQEADQSSNNQITSISQQVQEFHKDDIPQLSKNRSINSKKKRKSNISTILNLCDQQSQQHLDNQNMTASSSSSNFIESPFSPVNQISNDPSNSQSLKSNLYWDDNESKNYNVQNIKNIQDKTAQNQIQNTDTSNQGHLSIFKNVFNSFKKRLIFSNTQDNHQTPTQRSYSCDIQNKEEFQQFQEEPLNIQKEFALLKHPQNQQFNALFQDSFSKITRFCSPAINLLMPSNSNNNQNQITQHNFHKQ